MIQIPSDFTEFLYWFKEITVIEEHSYFYNWLTDY